MGEDINPKQNTLVTQESYAKLLGKAQKGFQHYAMFVLLCVALFAIIIGARWWMIGKFGSDLPFWDQWDGEGNVIKRYFDGTLTIGDLLAPFAEHRIFFTRILSLGLVLANGQWDDRLQVTVNAMVYALVPCGLLLVLSRGSGVRLTAFVWGILAVLFTLPYAWENIIFGFSSQMYFLIVFSLVAIFALPNNPVGSWPWFVGVIFGGTALLTMGSGLLASITVLGIFALATIREWPKRGELSSNIWQTAIVCALIVVAGYFLSARSEMHIEYRADSIGEFAMSLITMLSWPGLFALSFFGLTPGHDLRNLIMALLTWLPYIVFAVAYVSRKIEDGPRERLILGIGLWVLLQVAAMSFFRAKVNIQSRYMDMLIFGFIANLLSAIWLVNWQTRKGKAMLFLLMVWLVFNGLGLIDESFNTGLITWRKQIYEMERIRTAGFVATDDTQYLVPATDPKEIPYSSPQRLAEILRDPAIQRILPVGVQKSLPLIPVDGSPQPSFTEFSQPPNNIISQEQWDKAGIFSRFADIKPSNKFEYSITKKTGLSFLYLYFSGNKNNIFIYDSQGERHKIILLPSDDVGMWHRAFAYCPTMQCTIKGFADTSTILLMEPKEIGPLSIFAIVAGQWGGYIFGAGVISFIILLILLIWRNDKRTLNMQSMNSGGSV
jgi:hypothetical protein